MKGAYIQVKTKNHKRAMKAHRTTLLTLVHKLWGEKTLEDLEIAPPFLFSDDDLFAYIDELATISKREAQLLYVHLLSPYDIPLPPNHRLHSLFSKSLFATKHLNVAYSAGALVKRALPHAKTGDLLDRVAALAVIEIALDETNDHPKAKDILKEVELLTQSLAQEKIPIFQEISWLFQYQIKRINQFNRLYRTKKD